MVVADERSFEGSSERTANDRPSPEHPADAGGRGDRRPSQGPSSVRTLFLVEDDADVAHAFGVVASRRGWTVQRAATYREARVMLERPGFQCDAAIVDLQLPDGWGLDLVGALHAPPVLCAGLVVVTGLAPNPALAADVYARGACRLLWKPTGVKQLEDALDVAYRRSSDLRDIAYTTPELETPELNDEEERLFARAADRFLLDEVEVVIARRLCREKTDREIAAELDISQSALKRALRDMRAKMDVETRAGVVRRIYEAVLPSAIASAGGGAT